VAPVAAMLMNECRSVARSYQRLTADPESPACLAGERRIVRPYQSGAASKNGKYSDWFHKSSRLQRNATPYKGVKNC